MHWSWKEKNVREKFLVLDGYDSNGIAGLKAAGATQAGVLYKNMLAHFVPEDSIDIVEISHDTAPQLNFGDYQGVCWTGSNLFFSAADDIVQRHIDLCLDFFEAGTPQFGSCWAAQLAAVATGGRCEQNPKGREFGIARKIMLTDEGAKHPMFKGKPRVFDGFTSHADIVTHLPESAAHLAGNAFSPVQAIDVTYGKGRFWAVQYHPEYDCREVAALTIVRTDDLIEQGTFRGKQALDAHVDDLMTLSCDSARQDIAWKLGLDSDVLDPNVRHIEVQNWLNYFFA